MENDLLAMLETIADHLRTRIVCPKCDQRFVADCTCATARADLKRAYEMIHRAKH